MNRFILTAASAVATVAMVPVAHAAQTITFAPTAPNGSISGTFESDGIAAGAFTNIFNFSFPSAGFSSATISSIFAASQTTNVDFTSVTLNGQEFAIINTGMVEFRSLASLPVVAGPQVLRVSGTSGGNGAFAGTLSFAPAATAVPEPATWAMMIGGFGAVGGAMRMRRRNALTA